MSCLLQRRGHHPLFAGLRFGMLLQLAVGPVCLFIFRLGSNKGFTEGLLGVAAVALVDALYIFFAGVGITALLRRQKVQTILGVLGALVICLFGADILLGALGHALLPAVHLFGSLRSENSFLNALLLTASNPLTILMWSGVFSTKIAEGGMSRREVIFFGVGCVLATLSFLSIVTFLGAVAGSYLPNTVVRWMNGIVGSVLIAFGVKRLFKRKKRRTA